jgi:iron only hydrogenase large subunit-like protein
VEIYYPGLLRNISTSRSPVSMQGAMIKSYFAQKKGIDPRNIIHVAITPCTAKKFEIMRKELSSDGMRSTDFVITTKELSLMFKKRNINLLSQKGSFDSFMGAASGGGIIFGNTGGVMRAAIRTAYFMVTGINPPVDIIELHEVQGHAGLKEGKINIGPTTLQVAVCYEMRNAKILLDQVSSRTCKYHFIEVMACKGGCVGGAGQPTSSSNIEKRMAALNDADALAVTRYSHENKEVKAAYKDFLGDVGGQLAKKYLHTTYSSKADLL